MHCAENNKIYYLLKKIISDLLLFVHFRFLMVKGQKKKKKKYAKPEFPIVVLFEIEILSILICISSQEVE